MNQRILKDALIAQAAGDLPTAERLCVGLLTANFQDFDANHLLGIVRSQQGRASEACACFQAALAVKPDAVEVLARYAMVLHAIGRNVEALEAMNCALSLAPKRADILNLRGLVQRALDNNDAALDDFNAALELEPDNIEALNNRATILNGMGRGLEGLCDLDRAVELSSSSTEILFNRGIVLRGLERPVEAAECFSQILKHHPENPATLNLLGLALLEAGRAAEAMSVFRRHAALVRRNDPDPPHKLRHDAEQMEYLAVLGVTPGSRHFQGGEALAGQVVNSENDVAAISARWLEARPQIAVIDNLFTPAALEALRCFCQGSTIWDKAFVDGYVGAIPESGFAAPLLAQIARELPAHYPTIFGEHALRYMWAFKCDSQLNGVNVHADFAAVNVNFWITPDEANLDPDSGGLVIWDIAAPLDWNFKTYNNDPITIRKFLADRGARSVHIPYRANRAVIFDSDLFHETDAIAFNDGYTNRRINITMLYGRRRRLEG